MSRRVLVALVGLAAIVVVTAVWYVALWHPKVSTINQVKAQVAADNAQAVQLESQLVTKRAEALQFPAARATISRTKLAIPGDPAIAQLIYYVNNAASASQVAFLSITDSQPGAGNAPATPPLGGVSPEEITLAISGSGTFFNVLDFINHLDAMPRLLVISQLTLSPAGGSVTTNSAGTSSSPLLSFSISAQVFTSPAPATSTTTGGQ